MSFEPGCITILPSPYRNFCNVKNRTISFLACLNHFRSLLLVNNTFFLLWATNCNLVFPTKHVLKNVRCGWERSLALCWRTSSLSLIRLLTTSIKLWIDPVAYSSSRVYCWNTEPTNLHLLQALVLFKLPIL